MATKKNTDAVIQYLTEKKQAEISSICSNTNTSESTVRRILSQLEADGLVKRTRGGALLQVASEPPVLSRAMIMSHEKEVIARFAAAMINNGDTIFLASGSSVHRLCPYIIDKQISVITNSVVILNELAGANNIQTISIGGVLDGFELSLTGFMNEISLRELQIGKLFLSVRGIDTMGTLTSDNLYEQGFLRVVSEHSKQRIFLVDHTKFEHISPIIIGALQKGDVLVTTREAEKYVNGIIMTGVEVVFAN